MPYMTPLQDIISSNLQGRQRTQLKSQISQIMLLWITCLYLKIPRLEQTDNETIKIPSSSKLPEVTMKRNVKENEKTKQRGTEMFCARGKNKEVPLEDISLSRKIIRIT